MLDELTEKSDISLITTRMLVTYNLSCRNQTNRTRRMFTLPIENCDYKDYYDSLFNVPRDSIVGNEHEERDEKSNTWTSGPAKWCIRESAKRFERKSRGFIKQRTRVIPLVPEVASRSADLFSSLFAGESKNLNGNAGDWTIYQVYRPRISRHERTPALPCRLLAGSPLLFAFPTCRILEKRGRTDWKANHALLSITLIKT